MPSLFRFLTVVAVIGGIVYGVIFALANFVNPKPREMTVRSRRTSSSRNRRYDARAEDRKIAVAMRKPPTPN